MARLFREFPIELRPGVSVEEFEKFLNEDWVEVISAPGVRSYMLKGDRGAAEGRYQLVLEYDRVETRDMYSPTGTEASELWNQVNTAGAAAPASINAEERWAALVQPGWDKGYTDWKLVAE